MPRIVKILVLFMAMANAVSGQVYDELNQRVSGSFLKDSLTFELGKFGFNSYSISNNSPNEVYLRLQLDVPDDWTLLRELPLTLRLKAFEQRHLPIRIKPSSNSYGGRYYPFHISVSDMETGESFFDSFKVSLGYNSDWNATLLNPTIHTSENEILPDFKLRINNSGNRSQLFEVELESELRLSLPSSGTQLILKPGQDTILNVGVRSRMLHQTRDNVQVVVRSRGKEVRLDQNISFITNSVKVHNRNRYTANSTIRLGAINLLKQTYTSYYADFRSEIELPKNQRVRLRARTFYSRGALNLQNSRYSIVYDNEKVQLKVGSLNDFIYTQINGVGAKAKFNIKNQSFEAQSIKSFYNEGMDYSFRHDIKPSEKLNIHTESFWRNNEDTKVDFGLAVQNYEYRFDPKVSLKLKFGGSKQVSELFTNERNGYTLGYNFRAQKRLYSLNSYYNKSSGWFPGINTGIESQSHNLLVHKGAIGIGGFGGMFKREPFLYNVSEADYSLFKLSDSKNYGLQARIKAGRGQFYLKASRTYLYQNLLSGGLTETISEPEVNGKEFSLDYRLNSLHFNHNMRIAYGLNNLKDRAGSPTDLNFRSINFQMNGKLHAFGYTARVQSGPGYFFDYLFMIRTGNPLFRQQYSLYWSTSHKKDFQFSLSANYSEMKGGFSKTLYMNADIQLDIPRKDLNVHLSANGNMLGRLDRPLISMSLFKRFESPVPFFKKYSNLRIKLFKDKNNNKRWDKGELPVTGAIVKVDGILLNTNEKGEASLLNAVRKPYVIDFTHVDNQRGWKTDKLYSDSLQLVTDQEVFIPFTSSKLIMGEVRASFSKYGVRNPLELSKIKITARDEEGRIFETLTNEKGMYFLNVPPGTYKVSIDNRIIGSTFMIKKALFSADLLNEESQTIDFELSQKERKINIKRLD
ncbi:COG1470 family protein [Jiulongibacter sp. NS-SX5]|uniref:COG1470 family protein n=1 Tax=Jiulongibacter sp. NS-SX5 TaxID=3463854 RepID=UPI004059FF23